MNQVDKPPKGKMNMSARPHVIIARIPPTTNTKPNTIKLIITSGNRNTALFYFNVKKRNHEILNLKDTEKNACNCFNAYAYIDNTV